MAVTGQRFHIDFSSDGEDEAVGKTSNTSPAGAFDLGFVSDIKERSPSSIHKPASAPQLRNTNTGFPAHRKRSRFAQRRSKETTSTDEFHDQNIPRACEADAPGGVSTSRNDQVPHGEPLGEVKSASEDTERKGIDEENRRWMAQMSPGEIARERQELLAGLSPSLIERLLRKANIDDGRTDTGTERSLPDAEELTGPMKNSISTERATSESLPEEDGLEE
ncbi:MAG: hypothetical protein LQ347_007067, partial [Umbilicaria vellea]